MTKLPSREKQYSLPGPIAFALSTERVELLNAWEVPQKLEGVKELIKDMLLDRIEHKREVRRLNDKINALQQRLNTINGICANFK